ncbi:DUF2303 family protein [Variovorax sp. J22G73]|uniref:DUF2303 family protein n=1 Tax=unclassified Variovorax TaxID=663243 RepID=UPI0025784F3D|nr:MULTISPECIES: DUF2303 family protein [unclassified Variovorax]MDM0003922.1 DUF2303 family protein [Variovorax sp. J22R203]MDM0096412.1 DUF2303 family protein [Variovorax sp. J22G73]
MDAINAPTAQLVRDLTAAADVVKHVGDTTHLVVPPNYQVSDITKAIELAQNAPDRKRGTVSLGDLPSLLVYMKDQGCQPCGYVYADPDARTITAVFNDAKAGPGWRDHRAVFAALLTPEAKRWIEKNGHVFGQTEFAEFIEDNMADLQGEDAQKLLTVATTIAASTGINFSSAKRLQDGQTQLTYNESINATAGADGALAIPKTFTLGLRLFKNGAGYKLTARLKYRLHSGAVKFFYELERHENAIDDAFGDYIQQVRDAKIDGGAEGELLGYTVLIGKA